MKLSIIKRTPTLLKLRIITAIALATLFLLGLFTLLVERVLFLSMGPMFVDSCFVFIAYKAGQNSLKDVAG